MVSLEEAKNTAGHLAFHSPAACAPEVSGKLNESSVMVDMRNAYQPLQFFECNIAHNNCSPARCSTWHHRATCDTLTNSLASYFPAGIIYLVTMSNTHDKEYMIKHNSV
jgi:hypothetical protein